MLPRYRTTAHRRKPLVLLVHLPRPHMPVDVGGDADAGVPEYPPHHLQLRPLPQHLGGVQVPELFQRASYTGSSSIVEPQRWR